MPIIYFFYIETAGRTLEEIDLIFATGFAEHRSYVHVAKQLPKMQDKEIQSELTRLHNEHVARKGQPQQQTSPPPRRTSDADDATFVEAGDEVRGEMANEKAKDLRRAGAKEGV